MASRDVDSDGGQRRDALRVAIFAVAIVASCGDERVFNEPASKDNGSGGEAAASGKAGAGGGGAFAAAGSAGSSPSEPICRDGDRRCGGGEGNTVEECVGETWSPADSQCEGSAPLCTGPGVCAAYRVLAGTIDALGVHQQAGVHQFVVKKQTILQSIRICSIEYCVRGGVH
ncbi:MAG: hypothetical protein ACOY0T_37585 [Myxococcota bacterium]